MESETGREANPRCPDVEGEAGPARPSKTCVYRPQCVIPKSKKAGIIFLY